MSWNIDECFHQRCFLLSFAAVKRLISLYLGAKKTQHGTRLMLSNRPSRNKHRHILFVLENKSISNYPMVTLHTVGTFICAACTLQQGAEKTCLEQRMRSKFGCKFTWTFAWLMVQQHIAEQQVQKDVWSESQHPCVAISLHFMSPPQDDLRFFFLPFKSYFMPFYFDAPILYEIRRSHFRLLK